MPSDLRRYWRDPGFWRWWWQSRVSGDAKVAIAIVVAAAVAMTGYLGAHGLAATQEAASFTTQRVVTVVRKAPTKTPSPDVVTNVRTVTQRGETEAVTVRREGRTVVIRPPGQTVTASGRVEERVVTNARTDTVVRTETANRPTTVTTPGPTETVTHEVTQPTRTVTQTRTDTVTVTEPVTVTEEVTVTDEVTVTTTETRPK
jgi:hypothetical protein